MIFVFLLLLQLVPYNVEGKRYLVETRKDEKGLDGKGQRKVCKINIL